MISSSFNGRIDSFLKRYIPYKIKKELLLKKLFMSQVNSKFIRSRILGPTLVSVFKAKDIRPHWLSSYKAHKELLSILFGCLGKKLFGRKGFKTRKWRRRRRTYRQKPFNKVPLINKLKLPNSFVRIQKKYIKYCKIFFKYTGSNFFITITNVFGDVFFSYSAGVFNKLRTRKEKTTIFVAKELGELLGLRLFRLISKQFIFIPYLNHKKVKSFLRYFYSGVKAVGKFSFYRIFPKRKVTRNGVRLRKPTRK